ncbi:hypothetical protein M885DRAFT_513322, partial [Pelagophyceae sp. CCMP2097]
MPRMRSLQRPALRPDGVNLSTGKVFRRRAFASPGRVAEARPPEKRSRASDAAAPGADTAPGADATAGADVAAGADRPGKRPRRSTGPADAQTAPAPRTPRPSTKWTAPRPTTAAGPSAASQRAGAPSASARAPPEGATRAEEAPKAEKRRRSSDGATQAAPSGAGAARRPVRAVRPATRSEASQRAENAFKKASDWAPPPARGPAPPDAASGATPRPEKRRRRSTDGAGLAGEAPRQRAPARPPLAATQSWRPQFHGAPFAPGPPPPPTRAAPPRPLNRAPPVPTQPDAFAAAREAHKAETRRIYAAGDYAGAGKRFEQHAEQLLTQGGIRSDVTLRDVGCEFANAAGAWLMAAAHAAAGAWGAVEMANRARSAAERALEFDDENLKAKLRRGKAFAWLGRGVEAMSDFAAVVHAARRGGADAAIGAEARAEAQALLAKAPPPARPRPAQPRAPPAQPRPPPAQPKRRNPRLLEVLDLDISTFTTSAAKKAFRKVALEHHPDKTSKRSPGGVEASTKRFRDAKEAFDVLTSSTRRTEYLQAFERGAVL